MISLSELDSGDDLETALATLANGAGQLVEAQAAFDGAVAQVERDATTAMRTLATTVSVDLSVLRDRLDDLAQNAVEQWFDGLHDRLERSVTTTLDTCGTEVTAALSDSEEALHTAFEDIQAVAESAAKSLLEAGQGTLNSIRDEAEARIVDVGEEQARSFAEDALTEVAAAAGMDVVISQAAVAFTSATSAALPYLMAGKATLGQIKRVRDAMR